MKTLFYIFSFYFIVGNITAQTVVLTDDVTKLSLLPYFEVFRDTTNSISIDDAVKLHQAGAFKTLPEMNNARGNFAQDNATFWLRFSISANARYTDRLLVIGNTEPHDVSLYSQLPDGTFSRTDNGCLIPFSQRQYNSSQSVFEIIAAPETRTYYIQIRFHYLASVNCFITSKKHFENQEHDSRIIFGILYGIFLVMSLYNFFLYLYLRERSYLYYALFLFFWLLAVMQVNGNAFEYLWSNMTEWNKQAAPFLVLLSCFFVSLFSYSFFEVKTLLPRMQIVFKLLYTLMILLMVGCIFLPLITNSYMYNQLLSQVGGFCLIVLQVVVPLMALRKGYKPAYFYFLGWTSSIVGAFTTFFRTVGFLPDNLLTMYSVQIGSIFECLLFSLGLGYKINMLREQLAKQRLNNERILREEEIKRANFIEAQNKELEIKIQQRTLQLSETNEQLTQQKRDIEIQATQLQQAYTELQRLDQFKENVTAMIVHDLKNSLNFILNQPNNPSETTVARTKESGRQMLQLVSNILEVQRFEEAKIKLDVKIIGVAALLKRVIEQVTFLALQKNLTFDVKCSPHQTCRCDLYMIERVLVNLLTNAIKYSPANKTITIEVADAENIEKVRFAITDRGKGIEPEKKALIFSKYAPVDIKKSSNVLSTGLGLFFCKLAIESHGEQITVSDAKPNGTTFEFTLQWAPPLEREEQLGIKSNIKTLSQAQKQQIALWLSDLQKTEIYEITKLRQVVKQIRQTQPWASEWCNQLETAIYNENATLYKTLISND